MNTVDANSSLPIFVKHVANSGPPLCAETIGFYSKSEPVPSKKDLPVGVDRGFTRWASRPYEGTPIVYLRGGQVNNAVFRKFVKADGSTTTTNPVVAAQLSKEVLKAGTLYIDHYNIDKGNFFFDENARRMGVTEIHLMKDIPQCPFKK